VSPIERQLLIFTVLLAAVMELIDISIVNVTLSHMSGNLGATLEDTSWVSRLDFYTRQFQYKGVGLIEARRMAMGWVDLSVIKQSTLMSYIDSYMLIGSMFIFALPLLIFVIRKPSGKARENLIISDH
jgi:DHA2 family multidrug resistance protein